MFQSFIISQGLLCNQLIAINNLLPFKISQTDLDYLNENKSSNIPDILFIEPKKSIGIEDIRNLDKKIKFKPYSLPFKIIILNRAELLTTEAQNALLKTLEEPPSYVLIFLLVAEEDLLLTTIRSRCQILKLKNQKPQINEENLKKVKTFYTEIFSQNPSERLLTADNFKTKQDDLVLFFDQSLIFWYSLLNFHSGNLHTEILKIKSDNLALKYNFSPFAILKVISLILEAKNQLKKNINPNLCFDNFILSLPVFPKTYV